MDDSKSQCSTNYFNLQARLFRSGPNGQRGGVLVLAIGLVKLFKSRDFRNRTWKWIFIFFLVMGFFSAWEDQKQKRLIAETDREFYREKSEYNQHRIDKMTDDQSAQKNASYGTIAIDSHDNTIGVINEGDILGNVASVQNSPNANVNQSIVNPLPKPLISNITFLSTNVYDGSDYKTEVSMTIDNPTAKTVIAYSTTFPHSDLLKEPVMRPGAVSLLLDGFNSHKYVQFRFTLLTSIKINRSDISFFISEKAQNSQ